MAGSRIISRLVPIAVIVVVAVAPTMAHAQMDSRVVVTPYAGVYAPSADVFRFGLVGNGTTVSFNTRHQPAPAVGVTTSLWLDERVAIEAGGLYARSTLRADLLMNQVGSITTSHVDDASDVWAATLKLMIQALPQRSGLNLRIGLGPAVITRGGPAYRSGSAGRMTGLTDVGGALSLCTRVPVNRFANVRLRAEDLIYQARQRWESQSIAGAAVVSDPRMQHDFVISLGLQLNLVR
jgi:hypothetical protein